MEFLRLTSIIFFRIVMGFTGYACCLAFGIVGQNFNDNLKETL